jgi:hypothetical protein
MLLSSSTSTMDANDVQLRNFAARGLLTDEGIPIALFDGCIFPYLVEDTGKQSTGLLSPLNLACNIHSSSNSNSSSSSTAVVFDDDDEVMITWESITDEFTSTPRPY